MFCCLNRFDVKQCLVIHRKHVKRRLFDAFEVQRYFSNYIKLGDLYRRLGLASNVSQDDIKKAYYELSKEHHPDRNKGCTESVEKFRSITEAYEILGNVTTRAQYDRETPYGKSRSRPSYQRPQSSSSFQEKDEELAEKIRAYRENMRKRTRRQSSEQDDFTFHRENVFDFDAWYRAHFHDDFETNLRKERIKQYTQEYKERLARDERFRPPRPYVEREEKPPSDIEMQMEEMFRKEVRRHILNIFSIFMLFLIALLICVYIIEHQTEKIPFEELYAKKKAESIEKSKNK